MNLEYVLGPVIATDTLLNANLQFHRVFNRQAEDTQTKRGWAWTSDDDTLEMDGEHTCGGYDVDPYTVIDDICRALREQLTEAVNLWYEDHPKAAKHYEQLQKAGLAS